MGSSFNFQGLQEDEEKEMNEEFDHELQDDNNQFTTNESILINKVNEMQIKTSRFDSQRSRHLYHSPASLLQQNFISDQAALLQQLQISSQQSSA